MNPRKHNRLALMLPILAFLLGGCGADSTNDETVETHAAPQSIAPQRRAATVDETLRRGALEADAVFQGVVTAIEHRTSDVRGDADMAVPHTFVTFRVERPFKAVRKDEEVTLRFIGGPTGKGQLLRVPGIPELAVGDRAILMVKDNERSACPLVDCARALFRVSDGAVYTGRGYPIVVDGAKGLRAELREGTRARGDIVTKDSGELGGVDPQSKESEARAARAIPIGIDEFALRMESAVRAAFTDEELAGMPPLRGADIHAPFYIPTPTAVHVEHVDVPAPAPTSEQDRAEQEALIRNGNNPVLSRE